MEKIIIAGLIFWLTALTAIGQKGARKTPKWVPEKGFWVLQSNQDSSTVFFYDDDKQLIYKERLNRRLHVGRRRTKLWLRRELAQAMTAGRQNRPIYRQMMNGVESAAGQP
ncbi:MAG TPA: hypothetical protein VGM31_10580 [Puia sp.]